MQNTWLEWPPQHHHSSGRLLPKSLGLSPSPCQSVGLVAPGGPPLPLPASSPSRNTVLPSWARAEGRANMSTPPPKYTLCFYLSVSDSFPAFSLWESLFSTSESLLSECEWRTGWKDTWNTQRTRRSLCTLFHTDPFLPLSFFSVSLYPPHFCVRCLMKTWWDRSCKIKQILFKSQICNTRVSIDYDLKIR